MVHAQLADLGEVAQPADVEDQHARPVRAQQHGDALVRDVVRDDDHARIVLEQRPQAEGEQVLEVGDGDRDGGARMHGKWRALARSHGIHRHPASGG
jgi:hypothetical protein